MRKKLKKPLILILVFSLLAVGAIGCSNDDDITEDIQATEYTLNILAENELGTVEIGEEIATADHGFKADFEEGEELTLKAIPANEDINFKGWKASEDGELIKEGEAEIEVTMAEAKTYIAVFEIEGDDAVLNPERVEYDRAFIAPATTTVFWNDANSVSYLANENISEGVFSGEEDIEEDPYGIIEEDPYGILGLGYMDFQEDYYGNWDWQVSYDDSQLRIHGWFFLLNEELGLDVGDQLDFVVGFNEGEDALLTVDVVELSENTEYSFDTWSDNTIDAGDDYDIWIQNITLDEVPDNMPVDDSEDLKQAKDGEYNAVIESNKQEVVYDDVLYYYDWGVGMIQIDELTKAGEHELSIKVGDGAVEKRTLMVEPGEIDGANSSVTRLSDEQIVAGEDIELLLEIADEYGNKIDEEFNVEIDLDDGDNVHDENKTFEDGKTDISIETDNKDSDEYTLNVKVNNVEIGTFDIEVIDE